LYLARARSHVSVTGLYPIANQTKGNPLPLAYYPKV
jgi:hypothetical protein